MKEYRSPAVTGRRAGNSYSFAFAQAIKAMFKPDPDPKPFPLAMIAAVTDIASAEGALEPCLD